MHLNPFACRRTWHLYEARGAARLAGGHGIGVSTIQHILAKSDNRPGLMVLGGSNLIASYLLWRLAARGEGALVVARRPVDAPAACDVLRMDVLQPGAWVAPAGVTAISVLPLAILVRILPHLESVSAMVAIGSTSVFSKADSEDLHDREIATRLASAESALVSWCAARGITSTILRPTLVYDGIGDRNVARMRRVVRRYRVLPIAAPAQGLRQPIHADDIAKAILACLGNAEAANRAFNIAGGEILTYRAMAEMVFASEGRKPRFLPLPLEWLERGFNLAGGSGLLRQDGVGVSVFRRMNEDLVFDVAPGLQTLGYEPRRFELPMRT